MRDPERECGGTAGSAMARLERKGCVERAEEVDKAEAGDQDDATSDSGRTGPIGRFHWLEAKASADAPRRADPRFYAEPTLAWSRGREAAARAARVTSGRRA